MKELCASLSSSGSRQHGVRDALFKTESDLIFQIDQSGDEDAHRAFLAVRSSAGSDYSADDGTHYSAVARKSIVDPSYIGEPVTLKGNEVTIFCASG